MNQGRDAATGTYRSFAPQAPAHDDAAILRRLRRAYPHWAFLHDDRRSIWTALRGRDATIVRRDPTSLAAAVEAAQSRRPVVGISIRREQDRGQA